MQLKKRFVIFCYLLKKKKVHKIAVFFHPFSVYIEFFYTIASIGQQNLEEIVINFERLIFDLH